MEDISGYIFHLLMGIIAVIAGGLIGYFLSNELGFPFWPIIGLSITVSLGIVSLVLSQRDDIENMVRGNKVVSNNDGDAIGENQIVRGDKIKEQNIYLGYSDFQQLLWEKDPEISTENAKELATKMEETASSLREYTDDMSEPDEWSLNLSVPVVKDLRRLESDIEEDIIAKLSQLESQANGPLGSPYQSITTLPNKEIFRARYGPYRVLLDIDEANKDMNVLAIGHRKNIYRGI